MINIFYEKKKKKYYKIYDQIQKLEKQKEKCKRNAKNIRPEMFNKRYKLLIEKIIDLRKRSVIKYLLSIKNIITDTFQIT